jgi:hypothetical protein
MKRSTLQKPRVRDVDPVSQLKFYIPNDILERLEKIGRPRLFTRQDVVRPVVEMVSRIPPKRYYTALAEMEKFVDRLLAEEAAPVVKSEAA